MRADPQNKKSSLSGFTEVFSQQFPLSDAEGYTSRLLNKGGIADLLLLRTLSAICQKSRQPSFWEVIDSFVLLSYASLAAPRTLLQQLLTCLNFSLDSEDLSFGTNKKPIILKTTCSSVTRYQVFFQPSLKSW